MKTLLAVAFGVGLGLAFAIKTNESIRLEVENERLRAENTDFRMILEVTQPKVEKLDQVFQAVLLDTNHYQWQTFDRAPIQEHTYVGGPGPKEKTRGNSKDAFR